MADSGRTVFGTAGGTGLRIPHADVEIGVPLGRSVTEVLSGSAFYTVVWNRNDDSGAAFVGAVSFPEETCSLNSDHDTLSPDDGIYRFGWQLTLTAGVADAHLYVESPGAGSKRRFSPYVLPAGEAVTVGDSGIFLSYLDSLAVVVNNVSGNLSVGSGNLYVWRLDT